VRIVSLIGYITYYCYVFRLNGGALPPGLWIGMSISPQVTSGSVPYSANWTDGSSLLYNELIGWIDDSALSLVTTTSSTSSVSVSTIVKIIIYIYNEHFVVKLCQVGVLTYCLLCHIVLPKLKNNL